ncbi:PadR family transcriptional regulator [Gemmatimonadota bacterium]
MSDDRSELLKGTLDLMVLKSLEHQAMHGWGLAIRIEQISNGVFIIHQGALFPALQRLKRKGWITSEWGQTENNRRARYYRLTSTGRKQLHKKVVEWERVVVGMNGILNPQIQEG